MLIEQIPKNQRSIGLVLFPDARTGQLTAGGTTFHVGDNLFFAASATLPDALKQGAKLVVWLSWTQPNAHAAVIEHRAPGDAIAILRVEADVTADVPALEMSRADEPLGQHVFTCGFIEPQCRLEAGQFVTTAIPRAAQGIIGSRYVKDGALVYEVDFTTYAGESGAPLIRVADNVVVGVVRGSRMFGQQRGPTLVAPLKPILERFAAS